MRSSMRDHLIIGLDVATIDEAEKLVHQLGDQVDFYKIGYQLIFSGGFDFAKELVSQGKKVFLDVKLLDIGNTVASALENMLKIGISMVTVHAYPNIMEVAVQATSGSDLCLLGVTVLTSMDQKDLEEAGYCHSVEQLVLKRAEQARNMNMGGIVASAAEAQMLRKVIGPTMALVTPGIRLAGGDAADQKRVMTPGAALKAGASHLVVGRPVVQAVDPLAVVEAIFMDMQIADR